MSIEKETTKREADVIFIQLPLAVRTELTSEEKRFYGSYWKRFAKFASKQFKNVPAYDITEIPLWIATIGAALEDLDIKMETLDLIELSSVNPDWRKIESSIQKYSGKIFLLSPFTNGMTICEKICVLIKHYHSKSKIILGGSHVSYIPKETLLSCMDIDIIVCGIGSNIKDIIISSLNDDISKINGIVYRNIDNQIHDNRFFKKKGPIHLKRNYKLIPKFYKEKILWARIYTSIGCAYSCAYCADVIYKANKPSYRKLEDVLDEIDQVALDFDVKLFYIGDETFTYDRKFAIDFAYEMGKREYSWICQTRVDCIDPYLLESMRDGGCVLIKFGAENASEQILKLMRRNITVEDILKACRMAKKAGLNVFTYWMAGLPNESINSFKATQNLMKSLLEEGDIDLLEDFICVPYPGTDLFHNPHKYEISIKRNPYHMWREDQPSVLNTLYLSAEEIYSLWLERLNLMGELLS